MHVPLWVLLLISFAFTALGMYAILAWFAMRKVGGMFDSFIKSFWR